MRKTDTDPNRPGPRLRSRAERGALAVLAAAACLAVAAGGWAQTSERAAPAGASAFTPDATIVEIMDAIVMPAAQALWNAVSVSVTANGTIETVPETAEDWEHLRSSAIALAEAANTLIIPGRRVDEPQAVSADPESELGPKEIAALIDANRDAWIGYAHVLHETAMQSMHAVDARDVDALLEVGGSIDAACEACHRQFWYPNSAQ